MREPPLLILADFTVPCCDWGMQDSRPSMYKGLVVGSVTNIRACSFLMTQQTLLPRYYLLLFFYCHFSFFSFPPMHSRFQAAYLPLEAHRDRVLLFIIIFYHYFYILFLSSYVSTFPGSIFTPGSPPRQSEPQPMTIPISTTVPRPRQD